jgi:tRNA-dihydrouridine synthase B
MIGRAAIGYPWIFNEIKHFIRCGEASIPPDMTERVRVAKQHLEFSVKWKGPRLGIFEMRRHYSNYFKGIPDFKPFRTKLVEVETEEEIVDILDDVAMTYSNSLMSA